MRDRIGAGFPALEAEAHRLASRYGARLIGARSGEELIRRAQAVLTPGTVRASLAAAANAAPRPSVLRAASVAPADLTSGLGHGLIGGLAGALLLPVEFGLKAAIVFLTRLVGIASASPR